MISKRRVWVDRTSSWNRRFIWWPKRIFMGNTPDYVWVWWHWVERKARDDDGVGPWIYRLTAADAATPEAKWNDTPRTWLHTEAATDEHPRR